MNQKKENKIETEEEKKSSGAWLWWLGGCLGVIIVVAIIGFVFAWRAAADLTDNIDRYAEEFEGTFQEGLENVMEESIKDAVEESGETIDLDELNKLIEEGDWEAIEKMGKDLEKVNE